MGKLIAAAARSPAAVRILTAIIGAAAAAAARDPHPDAAAITPENAAAIERALVRNGATIPEVVNAVSAEPWWQSRILIGTYVTAAAPVIAVIAGREISPDDQLVITIALWLVLQAGGIGWTLFGRLADGLKPMWPRLRRLFGG